MACSESSPIFTTGTPRRPRTTSETPWRWTRPIPTALALSPDAIGSYGMLGRAILMNGDPVAALAAVEQERSDWNLIELPLVYYALGQIDKSDAVLVELKEKYEGGAAVNIAAIHAYRNEPDEAFFWLDNAVASNDPGLSEILGELLFSKLYDDPRWPPFLERIGRSPSQIAAIDFEIKLPE